MEESPTEACAQETLRVLRESSFCFIAVTLQFLQDGCSLDWFVSFDFFFLCSALCQNSENCYVLLLLPYLWKPTSIVFIDPRGPEMGILFM